MGVTAFKSLSNFSPTSVKIINHENGSSRVIPAGSARGFDYWIPWCTSQSDFPRHHIDLEVQQKRYSIWQSADADGDFVRFSTDGKYHGRNDQLSGGGTPGDHVPGAAYVDGNRLIMVKSDGSFQVQFSG